MKWLLIVLIAAANVSIAGEIVRNPAMVRAFKREHPCPANGKTAGPCPGYVVDHIIPLCAGGKDHPSNMQWQTKEAGLQKDKLEWWICRRKR